MSLISFKIIFQCVSWRNTLASSAKNRLNAKTIGAALGVAHRSPCEPHKGLTGRWMGGAWLSLARRFSARCKPGVTDALISAIYRRGVWKGTNASRPKIRFFFAVRNWMCGVRACENMQHAALVQLSSVDNNYASLNIRHILRCSDWL